MWSARRNYEGPQLATLKVTTHPIEPLIIEIATIPLPTLLDQAYFIVKHSLDGAKQGQPSNKI